MSKIISLKLTENLHCPDCGAEITLEERPCIHVSFIYLEESGEFHYVSDSFSQTEEKIWAIKERREDEYFNNDGIAVPRIKSILPSVFDKSNNSIIFEIRYVVCAPIVTFSNDPVVDSIYYGFEF